MARTACRDLAASGRPARLAVFGAVRLPRVLMEVGSMAGCGRRGRACGAARSYMPPGSPAAARRRRARSPRGGGGAVGADYSSALVRRHAGIRGGCRRAVWAPKTLSHHATCEYSWISPPSRSRRKTRIPVTSAGGCTRPVVNLASGVTDQELEAACLILQVHQQVAGLLSHSHAGGMGGDPARCTRRVPCSMKN
jgi:hypothetical protein